MSAKALSKIYHNPKDYGSLGDVEQLFRRARPLHFPGVTRQTVQDYLKSKQAYTRHSRRAVCLPKTTFMWQGFLPNGKPI